MLLTAPFLAGTLESGSDICIEANAKSAGPPSGADLTFAVCMPRMLVANVKSKAPLASIVSSGPLVLTFASVAPKVGCECQNRTTSIAAATAVSKDLAQRTTPPRPGFVNMVNREARPKKGWERRIRPSGASSGTPKVECQARAAAANTEPACCAKTGLVLSGNRACAAAKLWQHASLVARRNCENCSAPAENVEKCRYVTSCLQQSSARSALW